ncbi:MAG: hypothetical protein U1F41_09840 [Burkholderiales bacterium]
MKTLPGRRLAALLAAVALLASTLVPAHGMRGAGGSPALADVCRSQGNAAPDGAPNGPGDTGCAACCLGTAALPPAAPRAAASTPAFEAPAASPVDDPVLAAAGGNARAPPTRH